MNILTQYNSPNYTPEGSVRAVYGMPRSIDFITIHWWGNPALGPTFEGVVSWLCNPNSEVSAHDVITGTGKRAAVIVDYNNAAWHAGNARGNATSLGFECDPRARQEDYEAVAEDIAETWKYYGRVIPLRGHNSWIATQCPGIYDLTRLHNMAMAIYKGVKAATADEVRQAYRDILEREASETDVQGYVGNNVPITQVRNELMGSAERAALIERKAREAAEAAKPEWIRNLKDITDMKLAVLPAAGAKVINLESLRPVNDTIIPRGTQVDIAKETTVGGDKYYISNYAANKNAANGIKASDLGELVNPPATEKPEWLSKLEDIKDVTMYTRSETPVLRLADGTTLRTLPINTEVQISMATEIVGNKVMIIKGTEKDNQHEGIRTIYLSDTPIKNQYDDLEKRVGLLEALVRTITEFLEAMFKNFNKKG